MELFNHLRRSFLALTLFLFAICLIILVASEAAWLGRMVEAWIESKPYPSFSFAPLITDSNPWYTQTAHFLTFISGLGIFVISGALLSNSETTKEKIILALAIISSPIFMPLIALIIGLALVIAVVVIAVYIICSITFSLLEKLTREKLLLTTIAAIVGSSMDFVYQVFHPAQHSVGLLILSFLASGMFGATLEYLWTSKWWQRDIDRVVDQSIETYSSWRRQHRY